MASKKFKTWCRITDYVESVDPELAEILRGTCVDLSLNSLRGKAGITFLMPQDKALRKKIADLAYSDKAEDASKACDMLNAMIFRDVFKTPSDWMNKRDDIPNSLLPPQHVEIENATGKEVIFKSGAKAVLDERFKDSSKKGQLAVWLLVSGEIPVTTDKPAKLKYQNKGVKSKGKTGSYEVSSAHADNLRFKIAVAVENMYMMDHVQHNMGRNIIGGGKDYSTCPRNLYLEHTMSLVNFIMNVREDMDLLCNKVLPLISFQNIDFYFLLEPHKEGPPDSYLIPDAIIQDWWTNKPAFNLPEVIDQVGKCIETTQNGAAIYKDKNALLLAIDAERQKLNQVLESRPRNIVEAISKVYDELCEHNKIGSVSNVFPEPLAAYYHSEPGLKILQDELRYLTYLRFERLESAPDFDRYDFEQIINAIAEGMHSLTADERKHNLKLLNENSLRFLIQPVEKIQEIKVFVNSTHFLHVPLSPNDIQNYPVKNVIINPNPAELSGIWNIDAAMLSKHKRLATDSDKPAMSTILAALKAISAGKLSESDKAELLSIYSKLNLK